MPARAFHHGDLRAELLRRAREVLRDSGHDSLSLRQLARDAGVSHGAPQRHFADRRQLLDALAEQGFDELTAMMTERAARARGDRAATFREIARTYIEFAVNDSALMELMFARKGAQASPQVSTAAERFFEAATSITDTVIPRSPAAPSDPLHVRLLLVSTLHGIASLVAAGRLPETMVDTMIHDATRLFGACDSAL